MTSLWPDGVEWHRSNFLGNISLFPQQHFTKKGSHRVDGGRQKRSRNISLALKRRSGTLWWSSWAYGSSVLLSGSVSKVAQCLQWCYKETTAICVCVCVGGRVPEVHSFKSRFITGAKVSRSTEQMRLSSPNSRRGCWRCRRSLLKAISGVTG